VVITTYSRTCDSCFQVLLVQLFCFRLVVYCGLSIDLRVLFIAELHRFILDRLLLTSLVIAFYIMHAIICFRSCDKFSARYDKVNINSNVYNFSTATKCAKIHLFHSVNITFVVNHRLIKKGVNKQIKLFSPQ